VNGITCSLNTAQNNPENYMRVSRLAALPACIRAIFCGVLLAALAGCTTNVVQPAGSLQHVVVIWLKEPGNATHRRMILDESGILRQIPGVLSLTSGSVITSERAIVDSSFDVAMIVSFADKTAMDAYLTHPVHVTLVNQTLKPLVAKIRVFDFQ
jgi:predicted amino acid-binding ACT domain protein